MHTGTRPTRLLLLDLAAKLLGRLLVAARQQPGYR